MHCYRFELAVRGTQTERSFVLASLTQSDRVKWREIKQKLVKQEVTLSAYNSEHRDSGQEERSRLASLAEV